MSGDTVLSARDLRFGYEPERPILDGVNLSAEGGRLIAILGPNACGKTTLLKLLLGVLRPQSGEILLLGDRLETLRARTRAALVSYVPQESPGDFAFSVREVVEMGRFALESDEDALQEALRHAEVDVLSARSFSGLSSGQRQRALLSRAFYQSSSGGRAMLLDEPVSAMDLYHVHATLSLLRQRVRGGLTVVVVLQDINLAARYADDVWLLGEGCVVAAGPWEEVLVPETISPVYGVDVEVEDTSVPGTDERRRRRFDVRWK